MTEDIVTKLTRGEPGPALIEAAQEIRQLRNLLTAVREENERLRVKLESLHGKYERISTEALSRHFGVSGREAVRAQDSIGFMYRERA